MLTEALKDLHARGFYGMPVIYNAYIADETVWHDKENGVLYVRDKKNMDLLVDALNRFEKGIQSSIDSAWLSMLGIDPR